MSLNGGLSAPSAQRDLIRLVRFVRTFLQRPLDVSGTSADIFDGHWARSGLLALIALLALILLGKPALDGGLISLISLISHLNFANHPPGWSLR